MIFLYFYPFLKLKLYIKRANLQPQLIENLLLVAYIVTSIYKFDVVKALIYRCFCICSNWTIFHTELIFLKGIFQKSVYPENFIKNLF